MSIQYSTRRFFAALSAAFVNYDAVEHLCAHLEETGVNRLAGEHPIESAIDAVEEASEVMDAYMSMLDRSADIISFLETRVSFADLVLPLQRKAIIARDLENEILSAGLLSIIEQANAVATPNGTTNKLVRLAKEALDSAANSPGLDVEEEASNDDDVATEEAPIAA